mmetsp:Transcript_38690/g.124324  ORF Transcript_38690/g.124324 Transcript_38690/m.124324 type:complete len:311 (+) Transcript_38690:60-992(+)
MQYGTRGDDRVLKTSARNSVKIDALGFPRFVIAVLIVVHHFYKGPFGSHFDWAFAGVNFFFVLSGFVVTLSKVSKEWPPQGTLRILPVPQTLLRRVATNYPVYLAAVLLSVCCHGLHPYWWQVGAEVTLTSTWLPRVFRPEGRYYNVPLWFVSALACFWFLEEATFALVVCFWRSGRPHLASCLVFVAWMAATPFSLGFSALSTADFWTYGVLTPLFCLHVLGLPEGSDPLFRAFTMHPLPWLGELAYAIYAFQDPTVRLLKKCPGFDSSNSGAKVMIILGCLLPVAIVVQRYIQDPAGRWISHLAKRLA